MNEQNGPEDTPGGDIILTITKTKEGRLNIQAPSDLIMSLGMLEWANKHVWRMYDQFQAQAKAQQQPKVQIPGMRVPPPGQN